jgi:hypothetical protein
MSQEEIAQEISKRKEAIKSLQAEITNLERLVHVSSVSVSKANAPMS